MSAQDQASVPLELGHWYRNRRPIRVLFIWWYDTVAILRDYSDSRERELPAGTEFKVVETDPTHERPFRCELLEPDVWRAKVLPKRARGWFAWLRLGGCVVDFSVLLSREQLHRECERVC